MPTDANRTTEYKYTVEGQLSELIVRNSVTGDQVTKWHYGTTLADSEVASNSLLRSKVYPDSDDLGAGEDGSDGVFDRVEVSYNRQSETIEVKDQNETKHVFDYDGLGRLTHDCVGSLGSGVDGAVRRLSRRYDRAGRLESVSSWDDAEVGQGNAVNEVQLRYNGFGQLTREYQSHSGPVGTGSTPVVQYAYADGTNRHIRKLSTTYPNGREIAFSYGTSGSADDKLGRVHEIQDASAEDEVLARYTRRGISATMRIEYPNAGATNPLEMTYIKQSGESDGPAGDQYTGQDRFNRIIDIRWLRGGTTTHVDRIQYGFDRAGNRLWRKNVVAGSNWDELYSYDGLYQLPERQRGTLNSGNTGLTGTPLDQEEFEYDPAGNWMSATQLGESDGYVLVGTIATVDPGVLWFGHLIGTPPVQVGDTIKVEGAPFTVTSVMGHSPQDPSTQDVYLEVGVSESTSGVSAGDEVTAEGEMVVTQTRAHNKANEIISASPPGGTNPAYDGAGNMTLVPVIQGAQAVQREFTWDAWNRLVKIEEDSAVIGEYAYDGLTRRVWKESDEGDGVARRHFYYSNQWQVLEERVDESRLADRQFVWGLRYIDDLILRDRGAERLYATHDQWHVIGTVSTSGNATERFAYRAFGQTQVLEPNFTPTSSSASEWETTYGAYRWDPESGLYAVRFRYLHSGLGRWLSRDPIEYLNGPSLYSYSEENPVNRMDPLGLATQLCFSPAFGTGPANHVYLRDPKTKRRCERTELCESIPGNDTENEEDDPRKRHLYKPEKDTCTDLDLTKGEEKALWCCCRATANKGIWIPIANDCHTSLDRCFEKIKKKVKHPRFGKPPGKPRPPRDNPTTPR